MNFKIFEGIIDVSFLSSQQIIGRFHTWNGAAFAAAAPVMSVVLGGTWMA